MEIECMAVEQLAPHFYFVGPGVKDVQVAGKIWQATTTWTLD
jgi:hypothetical protein